MWTHRLLSAPVAWKDRLRGVKIQELERRSERLNSETVLA